MPYFETKDQAHLFYKDWGTGPAVVFIHGWIVGSDLWEYQMLPLVSKGLRCIAYDVRGCGRSDDPGCGYDHDTLADDLEALLQHLDLHEVTLVSHSMGSGVIARYLSSHGTDRIARTALIAPTTPHLMKTTDNPEGIDHQVLENIIAALVQDRPRYLAEMAPNFFGAGLPECAVSAELTQWAVNLALQASPLATIELQRANIETDLRPDMAAFTVPTLIIHGDSDWGNPIELTAIRTSRAIPNSRLVVYENGPHGLFITHQERINRDLREFIQSK